MKFYKDVIVFSKKDKLLSFISTCCLFLGIFLILMTLLIDSKVGFNRFCFFIDISTGHEYLCDVLAASACKRIITSFLMAIFVCIFFICLYSKIRKPFILRCFFTLCSFLFFCSLALFSHKYYEYWKEHPSEDLVLCQNPRPYDNYAWGGAQLIAHAGGEIDGKKYTNSLEALENAFSHGYKFIELDLLQTTDGHIVAAHDWASFNRITGFEALGDTPLTLKEFLERKIYQKYTPIDAVYITQAFNSHPEACLVTDKIQDFQAVLQQLNISQEQLFVEVFSLEAYIKALKAGICYPMLCIWNHDTFTQYKDYVHSGHVKIVTFALRHYNQMESELRQLVQDGVAVFAFTSNDINFMEHTGGDTITAFYTDVVLPQSIKAEAE